MKSKVEKKKWQCRLLMSIGRGKRRGGGGGIRAMRTALRIEEDNICGRKGE